MSAPEVIKDLVESMQNAEVSIEYQVSLYHAEFTDVLERLDKAQPDLNATLACTYHLFERQDKNTTCGFAFKSDALFFDLLISPMDLQPDNVSVSFSVKKIFTNSEVDDFHYETLKFGNRTLIGFDDFCLSVVAKVKNINTSDKFFIYGDGYEFIS